MIDYNSDVLPLEQGGMDDAAIASFLSAKTNKDVLASELENFLGEESLAKRNAITGAWEGVLIDTMNEGGEIGEGLEELFSHLNKPRSVVVETSKTPWAEKASLLISGLFVADKISESQANAIYALAGGKAIPDGVTLDDVAAARARQAAFDSMIARRQSLDSLLSEISSRFLQPEYESTKSIEDIKQSIKQSL